MYPCAVLMTRPSALMRAAASCHLVQASAANSTNWGATSFIFPELAICERSRSACTFLGSATFLGALTKASGLLVGSFMAISLGYPPKVYPVSFWLAAG